MMKTILLNYMLFLVFLIFLYRYVYKKKHALGLKLGGVFFQWSSRFNFFHWPSGARVLILMAAVVWAAYSIITSPGKASGHFTFLLWAGITLSYPLWMVRVGKNGITHGLHLISWNKIKKWRMLPSGNRAFLFLQTQNNHETFRIQIPPRLIDAVSDVLKKEISI